MTFEQSFLLALPSITIALLGILIQAYRDKNKPAIDSTQIVLNKTQAQKIETEIAEKVMELANEQIKDLSDQVAGFEEKLAEAEAARRQADERAGKAEIRAQKAEQKNTIYLNGIYILTNQLITNGHQPQWTPTPTGPLANPPGGADKK